ncbi:MAG: class I SAM-dependent methyltransferase [Thermoplasmataceae archaeon]
MKNYGIVVPRDKFVEIYDYLMSNKIINPNLRIISENQKRIIPTTKQINIEPYESGIFDFRTDSEGSIDNILQDAVRKFTGDSENKIRWHRMGKSIVIRPTGNSSLDAYAGDEIAKREKAISVYVSKGTVRGEKRFPEFELIAGKDGDIEYRENGIKYILNPTKIMISKGNINERNYLSRLKINPDRILDMFAGIGYFSLPAAKLYSECHVTCLDINEESLQYLRRAAILNGIEKNIEICNVDCRVFEDERKYSLVIMGNFKSYAYLVHALKHIEPGSRIIMHMLLPSERVAGAEYNIIERIKKLGYNSIVEDVHKVKSYSPHVWHISVTVLIKASQWQ